ncbi:hypothetical protein HU200_029931 [Digitaria exilis]|uniref:Methylenetetrahydrofolate reductase n=1 Tax=Digitaria exilis TaxID=1010633 RepID=A0A835BPH5_9POAL|nr:hypothetical protein HU200_029931 [Digitaria exilis]
MKVIEKIQKAAADGRTVFSFEYFPPKTDDGVDNLLERMDRMVAYGPTFCDITWGAGGSTADATLKIAKSMQNLVCVETMMHLTCTNMPVEKIDHALQTIKSNGIQNVLALRGDPPHGQDKFVQVEGGFSCALNLVKHIKDKYDGYFGITVAGYPEAHPDEIQADGSATPEAYNRDLDYLKRKVDAGADFIITQLFYDTDIFLKFVNDCRQIGITCPIVPGIMPINNYNGFKRMTTFCKTKIPAEIIAALDPIKENDEAVKAYGIQLGTDMCKKILASGIKTLHLYTLNMDKSALEILKVILMANRPKSYITRTAHWNQYPHGRWGDSGNKYAQLTDDMVISDSFYSVYIFLALLLFLCNILDMFIAQCNYLFIFEQFTRPSGRSKKLNDEWVAPLKSAEDIKERFTNFYQGKLTSFPWSESYGLQQKIIDDQLVKINQKGFLTINSQPAVNGEKSDSPTVGWGGPGGYVYQKAYLEFFCTEEKLGQLIKKIKEAFPSLTYMALGKNGKSFTNIPANAVNAVTWGVFPGKEIIQPTVVESASFKFWMKEAFEIWAHLFGKDDSSALKTVLHDTPKLEHSTALDNYYLVSLVDNDYVRGNLFAAFKDI